MDAEADLGKKNWINIYINVMQMHRRLQISAVCTKHSQQRSLEKYLQDLAVLRLLKEGITNNKWYNKYPIFLNKIKASGISRIPQET